MNSLTVDVEEWFHVCGVEQRLPPSAWRALPARVVSNTRLVLDLLDRLHVRATFFVLGWVAREHPRLVAEICAGGHEIASHGHWHRRVYEQRPEEFEADLDASLAALAAAGAPGVRGYRAPEWSIAARSLWALDVLARKGFRYDSSMSPLRVVGNPAYPQVPHERATAHGAILEYPPAVRRWLGQNVPLGGGWGLRMMRPGAAIAAIEERNRRGVPAILFVHPWELDPDPPRLDLPWALRFSHYFRLSGYRGRLEQILRALPFGPIGEMGAGKGV